MYLDPETLQEAREALDSGKSNFELRNMSTAIRLFEKAANLARDNHFPIVEARAHYGIGGVYKYQFRFKEALTHYHKALSVVRWAKNSGQQLDGPLDPKLETDILLSLGFSHSKLGQQAKAIEYTKEILAIKPSFADAYYNLGCYYAILEDREKSLEYLLKGKQLFDGTAIRASRTDPDLANVRNDPRFKKIMYQD